jgi:hypothetical protein
MARARVVDFDYYHFLQILRRATNAGHRIEKSQSSWSDYITQHGINEIAASAIARQKFEDAAAVIIEEGRETDGLYFYSKNEEGCLRLIALE